MHLDASRCIWGGISGRRDRPRSAHGSQVPATLADQNHPGAPTTDMAAVAEGPGGVGSAPRPVASSPAAPIATHRAALRFSASPKRAARIMWIFIPSPYRIARAFTPRRRTRRASRPQQRPDPSPDIVVHQSMARGAAFTTGRIVARMLFGTGPNPAAPPEAASGPVRPSPRPHGPRPIPVNRELPRDRPHPWRVWEG